MKYGNDDESAESVLYEAFGQASMGAAGVIASGVCI